MNKDMLKPPLVLTLICLIVTAALVITFNFTQPFIELARAEAADRSRALVFATADSFEPYAGELPAGAVDLYFASSGGQQVGCVITTQAKGYGGLVTVMSAFDPEGRLVGLAITGHSETPGLGTKVAEPAYLEHYTGLAATDWGAVDAVSGATVTSNALKEALRIATEAFTAVLGEGAAP